MHSRSFSLYSGIPRKQHEKHQHISGDELSFRCSTTRRIVLIAFEYAQTAFSTSFDYLFAIVKDTTFTGVSKLICSWQYVTFMKPVAICFQLLHVNLQFIILCYCGSLFCHRALEKSTDIYLLPPQIPLLVVMISEKL